MNITNVHVRITLYNKATYVSFIAFMFLDQSIILYKYTNTCLPG